MRVLITGGAGFVGHNLANYLVKKKYKVNVIDNLTNGNRKNLDKKINFFKGDIRNLSSLIEASKGCNVILHLAAMVELRKSIDNPNDCFDININGTTNVIKAMQTNKIKKIVFASSCSIYPLALKNKIKENSKIDPSTPYSISKYSGEKIIKYYSSKNKINFCILRFFNIYGIGQSFDSPYAAVIPKFIYAAIKNKKIYINGNGKQKRDFINIKDVIKIYELVIKNQITGTYNVGTGKSISINQLIKYLLKFFPNLKKTYKSAIIGDAMNSQASIEKINKKISLNKLINIEEGLETLIKENLK